jgi:hypothetical protein
MSEQHDEVERDLADGRAQVRDSELFSPAVTARIDALRPSVHAQLRQRAIDPASLECEQTWLVAGGALAQPQARACRPGNAHGLEHVRWASSMSCRRALEADEMG